MTQEALLQKLHQYALDELATIDGVVNPNSKQLNNKIKEIVSWPLFRHLNDHFQVRLV